MSTHEIIIRVAAATSILFNLWLLYCLFDANVCLNWFYRKYYGEARISAPKQRKRIHEILLRLFTFPIPRVKSYLKKNTDFNEKW